MRKLKTGLIVRMDEATKCDECGRLCRVLKYYNRGVDKPLYFCKECYRRKNESDHLDRVAKIQSRVGSKYEAHCCSC